jgi:hypothetical protein
MDFRPRPDAEAAITHGLDLAAAVGRPEGLLPDADRGGFTPRVFLSRTMTPSWMTGRGG